MYWASNVGAYGIWVNNSSGNKTKGVRVPIMCSNRSIKVPDGNTLRSNPRPIAVSQQAKRVMETCGARSPNVSVSSVRLASSSAGLRSEKNFKRPNQKKILPRLRRNIKTL